MKRNLVVAGLVLTISPVFAQTAAPLALPKTGNDIITPKPDAGLIAPQRQMVIKPDNPDPAISVKPPVAGITPVLPPPGTGALSSGVTPK